MSKIASNNYTIKTTARRNPRLQLLSVPIDTTDDEIIEAIHYQNDTINSQYTDTKSFRADIKIVLHQRTNRKDHQHIIIEVSPTLRKLLTALNKVRIGWSTIEVRDFILITRCFKCCGYGHIAANCKAAQQHCSHCAGDHKFKDCTDVSDTTKNCCINCTNENKRNNGTAIKTDHNAMDSNCPSFVRQKASIYSKTNYG